MSEAVERRIVALLDRPLVCPHGSPIPGLDELGLPAAVPEDASGLVSLTTAAEGGTGDVVVDRISEQLQPDAATMHRIDAAGLRPGRRVRVDAVAPGVEVCSDGVRTTLDRHVSDHVFVRAC